jgi:hypothetical protein
MSRPDPILEDNSPNGNMTAIVEDDGESVYFYLFRPEGPENARVKTCWVRNRRKAPTDLDVGAMRKGGPPLLPAKFCRHPNGAPPFDAKSLRIVWFEEGDAAALLEHEDILAIIPCWSGTKGFHGFARDCTEESPLCWPLDEDNVLHERVRQAREYWSLWADESFWERYREESVATIARALGGEPTKYYAIDGGEWPPKALLRYSLPDRTLLVTIGVSLRSQPNVELYVEDPSPLRRIELAGCLDPQCPEDEVLRFTSYLSGQSGYPWSFSSWLGDGHTMPCNAVPEALGGRRFPFVLLTKAIAGAPDFHLSPFRGDPINVLWTVPITETERDLAEQEGSSALRDRRG